MANAKYVDGFVLTIKKKDKERYKKLAKMARKVWLKHGALEYKECAIEDKKPQWITLTFPKLTKAKQNEIVVFSYIEYKSRKHRDQVNKKVMNDPQMKDNADCDPKDMPFDMKKISYGGFEVLV